MDIGTGIAISAAAVSMVGVFYSALSIRQTASHDEIEDLRNKLKDCTEECRRLRAENIDLLRRVVRIERDGNRE